MVHARLHIICGNCGSRDHWERARIDRFGRDTGESCEPNISLSCDNCATVHHLDGYFEDIKIADSFVEDPYKGGKA